MAADASDQIAWDSQDGIADPRQSRLLVGHDRALGELLSAWQSGRMHHGWLLSGPRGIGKATLAIHFASHVLRNGTQFDREMPADRVHSQIAAGAHPNLLHLRRALRDDGKAWRTRLTVDEIRRTLRFFNASAGEAGFRVCIVDTADDMNENAANALLKILEEPPPRTIFLVLASTPGGLLPTIRSRCQALALRPLDEADLAAVLHYLGIEANSADIALATKLAGGSARRAILLLQEKGVDLYRRFVRLAGDPARPDWGAIHQLAGELAPVAAEGRFRLFIDLAHDFVARRIRGEGEPEGVQPSVRPTDISALVGWCEVWEKTARSVAVADSWNLDRKQVILNLFTAMRDAA